MRINYIILFLFIFLSACSQVNSDKLSEEQNQEEQINQEIPENQAPSIIEFEESSKIKDIRDAEPFYPMDETVEDIQNQILQESIGHLLTRPVGRPPNHVQRYYNSFSYQAGSWDRKRRVVAKVEWHPGELVPLRRRPRELTARRKRHERCVWMAGKVTEWPSNRGPITKIMSSDGCNGNRVPLEIGPWCDFREFGCHLGNVGLTEYPILTTHLTHMGEVFLAGSDILDEEPLILVIELVETKE